ncbi:HEAT repeat domain-containing protein [Leptolyngbya sp. 7M]|nr:HEAT repeat domain-containing protein [Leptolyngbya sp. 7M]
MRMATSSSADPPPSQVIPFLTAWKFIPRKRCRPLQKVRTAEFSAQMADVSYDVIISTLPPLIEGLRRDPVAAVRSNCAWSIGQLCRELPSNVVYAKAIDALIEAFAEDPEMGVREDAKTAVLKVGDTRGLQVIEELELEGWQ